MPLFSTIERRSPRGRVAMVGIYGLLTLGAVTMVYPFLLMLGMSVTNNADNQKFRAWPPYLSDDTALYQKYLCERYDQDVENYNELHATGHGDFNQITGHQPEPHDAARQQDLQRFIDEVIRGEYIHLTRVFYRKYPLRLAKHYNAWLMTRFGSLEAINTAYRETQLYAGQFQPPFDAPLYRLPKLPADAKERDWALYKKSLPWTWLCLPSSHGRYRKFVRERYRDIASLNAAWGSAHSSFDTITVPSVCPQQPRQAADWRAFVEEVWPPSLVLADGTLCTVERLWSEYLQRRYPDLPALRAAHGAEYGSFSAVPIPYGSVDRLEFAQNKGKWRRDFVLGNYRTVLDYLFLRGRAGVNTILLVVGVILLQLTINPLCAYALSRFRMRRSHAVLLFCLATMSFPAEVAMIPNFVLLKNLGLLNTLWALMLPGAANGFFIFLLKGFFDSLDDELFEAAVIDGASPLRCFWSVALPLCKPVLAVIALQAFTYAYGSFMWAYLVCQDSRYWTLMVYIHQFQIGNPVHMIMAALVIAAIPTLVVFLLCQNVIMRGIVVPTMK